MGLGTSLLLIAVGAVLRFAVSVSTNGINIHTVGVILMVVGGVGFLISLFWMAWASDRRNAVVTEREVPPAAGYRETGPRY
jgi:sulfite exporter TauE/SafE